MVLESLSLFLQTSVQMGTHILFAVLGGILCEKVGNLNLGIEGMMLLGAASGFFAALTLANPLAAVLAAGLAGSAGALIYAFITVTLRGNQVVTGLVLTVFGAGVSGYMGKGLTGKALPEQVARALGPLKIPLVSRIPVLGPMIFSQNLYVYASVVLAVILWVYLTYTRKGLNARAVGENPGAADSSGISVSGYKYAHILLGGFLCGVGGSFLSLVLVPRWQENITAGAGWIAVALVIFSGWHPLKALGAAWLFGALKGVGFKFQSFNLTVLGRRIVFSPQILDMLPYIATVLALAFTALGKRKTQAPASLGTPYFREER
ncbi:MAG: ABC transporter permease [Spirochaetaceae bacterium]|jgi:simple sugar transport system permease protein|nr:ABC transporter permease [Spirochaetaceae bacterium]